MLACRGAIRGRRNSNQHACWPQLHLLGSACAIVVVCGCTQTELLGSYPAQDEQLTVQDAGTEAGASAAPNSDGTETTGVDDADDASAHRGQVLLFESFDDGSFTDRGWYDGPGGTLVEGVNGNAFECVMSSGVPCERPGRIAFEKQESVYVSYWIRFSAEYDLREEVSQLFLLTDADDEYVGPALSHLTVYLVQSRGHPEVGVLDNTNVDKECVLLSDGSIVGCDGDFDSYSFGEERSVNACNGVFGNPTYTTCHPNEFGGYYSYRGFVADSQVLSDTAGSGYKGDWHFVEALVELNSVALGIGQADGRLRMWVDGNKQVDADGLILRTGQFPEMHFEHVLVAPVALDSELDQRLYMDELTVAVGIP